MCFLLLTGSEFHNKAGVGSTPQSLRCLFSESIILLSEVVRIAGLSPHKTVILMIPHIMAQTDNNNMCIYSIG